MIDRAIDSADVASFISESDVEGVENLPENNSIKRNGCCINCCMVHSI